jgi:hypothetical protein
VARPTLPSPRLLSIVNHQGARLVLRLASSQNIPAAASSRPTLRAAAPPPVLRAAAPPPVLRAAAPPPVLRAAAPPPILRAAAPLPCDAGPVNLSRRSSVPPKPLSPRAAPKLDSLGLDEPGAYDDRDGAGCSHW